MTRIRRNTLNAIAAAIMVVATSACSEPRETETPPNDWIVAIDVSGSRSAAELRDSRNVVEDIIAKVRPEGRLTLTQVLGGDSPREWRDSVPRQRGRGKETAADRRRRDTWQETARAAAGLMVDPNQTTRARETDLLNTLFRVADYVAASGEGRTTLVLLSDMINESAALDLAHGDVPGSDWIADRNAHGLLPNLRDVCIAMVGARVSTARGVAVREFWNRYLTASGARVRQYRGMTVDVADLECAR